MRKRFRQWFNLYGLMGDSAQNTAQLAMIERACWRAYQRGLKDGKVEADNISQSIFAGNK